VSVNPLFVALVTIMQNIIIDQNAIQNDQLILLCTILLCSIDSGAPDMWTDCPANPVCRYCTVRWSCLHRSRRLLDLSHNGSISTCNAFSTTSNSRRTRYPDIIVLSTWIACHVRQLLLIMRSSVFAVVGCRQSRPAYLCNCRRLRPRSSTNWRWR